MSKPHTCRYQCGECGGKFRWLLGEPEPLFCPLCSAYVGEDTPPDFVPKAPLIAKLGNTVPDKVFRDMEKGSIERADQAHEIGGGDRADYNNLHITNLKDNLKEGEIAAVTPPPNPVQRFMQLNPTAPVGIQGAATAQGYAAMAHTGPFPYAGAKAIGRIQEVHNQVVRSVQARGEQGRG